MLICLIVSLTACGQVSASDRYVMMEQPLTKKIAHAVEKNELKQDPTINFSWIEKAFYGELEGVTFSLGTIVDKIIAEFGTPKETGFYEGGEYFEYETATYISNPQSREVVAIARPITQFHLNAMNIKKALGTPDVEDYYEMDGLWVLAYTIGDNRLLFEFPDKNSEALYVWLLKENK